MTEHLTSYCVVGHGQPLVRTVSELPAPTEKEVLLKVSACGVCHTDLHVWEGFYDLGGGERLPMSSRGIQPPITLGHEIVGTVVAAGPEAKICLGEKRVAFSWIGCDNCITCASGNEHLCLNARTLGIFRPGGYANHVLVPDEKYLFDYSGIPAELAATLACSGITVYSALRKLGDPDLVGRPVFIGAGGLGLNAIQVSRALGFQSPIVLDIDPGKLDAAARLGNVSVINPADDSALEAVCGLTGGGAIAVVDFVGSESSARLGIEVLRRGGKYIIIGLVGGKLSLPTPAIVLRAISIMGSYVGSLKEFAELIEIMKSGRVASFPITVRNLNNVNEVLQELKRGDAVGRIVLQP